MVLFFEWFAGSHSFYFFTKLSGVSIFFPRLKQSFKDHGQSSARTKKLVHSEENSDERLPSCMCNSESLGKP